MTGHVPPSIDGDLLSLYLSDHLTGATAGRSRIERMAGAYGEGELGPDLRRLAAQIGEEHTLLQDLIGELGLSRRPHRQALAWLAEHAGRLKLNKRLLSTSPLTVVLELELMRTAVVGKLGGWQTLVELAPELDLDRSRFETLVERAKDQAATLERLHAQVRGPAFHVGQAPH